MTSIETRTGKAAVALATIAIFAMFAGYLGLTHLGVIGRDPLVTVKMTDVGDQLGPGSKVRHRGMIVGRVVDVKRSSAGARIRLRIDSQSAAQISDTVRARVLPSTVFGSDYVELVGDRPTSDTATLSGGATVAADESTQAIRLQNSMKDTLRLLESIDVESLASSTSTIARALDGNGDTIGAFITRAKDLTISINADAELSVQTLRRTARVTTLIADIEPELLSAGESSRTTMRTISASEGNLQRLFVGYADLFTFGERMLSKRQSEIVALLDRTRDPLATTAERRASIRALLRGAPAVLHNGAATVRDGAIQLRAIIGTDPLSPYTAQDCPRYGQLAGPNCGRGAGAETDDELTDEQADELIDSIEDLLGSRTTATKPRPRGPKSLSTPTPEPEPGQESAGLAGLLDGIFGGR